MHIGLGLGLGQTQTNMHTNAYIGIHMYRDAHRDIHTMSYILHTQRETYIHNTYSNTHTHTQREIYTHTHTHTHTRRNIQYHV